MRDWAVWQARVGCYSQAALSYNEKTPYVSVAVPSGPSSLVPEEREGGHPAEPVGLVELGGGRVHPRLVHLRRVHRAGEELQLNTGMG